MNEVQIFFYIVIAIIYLVYKANSANKKKNKAGKTPAKHPSNSNTRTTATSNKNAELESFLKELSKDIDKPSSSTGTSYRSLEQESTNYDKTAQNYDKLPHSNPRKKSNSQKDFSQIQQEQLLHAKTVSERGLSQAQKNRLKHARANSSLSEEQKNRLKHAQSISKKRQQNKTPLFKDADDIRKAFIMSEIFNKKF